ncbi:unnamed protein product [Nezara viridula]|uniref:chitinase n=2 Tax=Nezara viridula TaxID=85310 RepID=A0A9P0MIJ7_NEZVI|nr:unnamed protein product [Nezara viridula]
MVREEETQKDSAFKRFLRRAYQGTYHVLYMFKEMWLFLLLLVGLAVAFRRDAVESPPAVLSKLYEYKPFGVEHIDLRDSVEKVPTQRERMQESLPLRSAVEKRPTPYFRGPWWKIVPGTKQLDQSGRRLFCFVESWSSYRRAPVGFTADNIDPYACTHVIYAFASVDPLTSKLLPLDEEYDVVKGGYRSIVGLKRVNSNLKVMISVAGRLSKMTSSASSRRNFILSTVKFMAENGFDGLDLHWEYPGAEDLGGSRSDKDNLSLLVEELSGVMESRGWLLSASFPPSRFRLDDGYDIPRIAPYLHFVLLKSFDYHQEREGSANHPSPLVMSSQEDPLSVYYNVDYSVRYYLKRGVRRNQLIIGVPFFARSYTLKDANNWMPGSPVKSPGKEARFTQQPGFMAYYEVCNQLRKKGWVQHRDSNTGSAFMVKDDQWVGFEDPYSIRLKMTYMQRERLGGAMVWALDLDDFKGLCGPKYPLLNTVRVALTPEIPGTIIVEIVILAMLSPGVGVTVLATQDNCTGEGYAGEVGDCSVYYRCQWAQKHTYICPHGLYYDPQLNLCNWPTLVTCQKNLLISAASSIILAKKGNGPVQKLKEDGPRVVCYFTNWAWYRKGEGKFIPEHIEPSLCTHIIYAFASLEPNTLGIVPFDSWADIDNGMYKRIVQLREKGPAIMLALGGWTDSIGEKYSKMVSSGSSRRSFINSVVAFLRRYEFSGLSLEWNHPVCWQSDCSKGPASDAQNYAKLAQEIREAFDKEDPPLLLSVSLSGYPEVIKQSYDLSSLSKSVDFFTVMSYDYHGAWEGVTGHVAPIKGHPPPKFSYYNIEKSLELLINGGAEKSKLVLGVPMYGQSYTLANRKDTGINSKTKGPGDAGKWTAQPGMLAYYEICYKIRKNSWRKETTEYGPYAYLGDQWVSFDDEKSIAEKGSFVKSNGLGGLMAWTIDLDDFQNLCCDGQFPLLSAINKALGRDIKGPLASGCTRPKPPVTPAPPTTTLDPEAGITTTEHQHTHWTEATTKPTSSTPWWTPETTKTTTSRPTTTTTRRTTTTRGTTTRRTTTTKRPTTTSTSPTPWWTPESTTTKPSTSSTPWWVPESTTTKPSTTTPPWWVPETTTTTKRPTTTKTTTNKPSTSTSTEKEQEQTGEQNTELPSTCQTGDYKPVQGNCQEYYRCILGEFRKERCAGDLHWNELRTICDWPSEAKCTSEINVKPSTEGWMTTKPTTQDWWPTSKQPTTRQSTTTERMTTTQKPTTTTKEPFEMVCQNGQYYPVSGNCAAFHMCVNGILIEQPCAPGLHWNMDAQICDWSFSSKCSPDTAVLVKAEQGCNRGIFAPHHKNCNKYLQCQWDKYEVHTCAPGLHWNQKKMICDWPKSADCDRSGGGDADTDVVVATEAPSVTVSSTYKPSTTTEWTWKPEEQTEWSWTSTTTEEPWPETPYQHPLSGHYKVVCYFTNWAWYRQGSGKYLPEDIDYDLCTHIIYGFAVLDYSELIIKSHDSWADFDNNFYNRVVWFRRKGVKVLLALGGWNDSQGDKYSRLVNNPAARSKFIAHAVPFLQKYKFDGLDLDWEYPKCWQTNCNQGKDSDKEAFAMWVKELKTEFNKHGLLLSAAVSPSKTIIDVGYDLPVLAQYLDWISVMTYDYHGQWDKKTGHVAPMYEHPEDDFYYFNANYTIHYWINGGVPSRKLVMGMPMYGQGFTLSNEKDHGLNAPAPRPAEAGEYTRAAGFLAYYEICDRIKNRGWTVVKDEQHRMGPYAYHGTQWVGFDDQEMIKLKSEYIRDMDLGGGMIWALDLDDFKNTCGQGKHPLLNTIAKTLASPPNGTPTRPTTTRPTTSKPTKPTKPSYKPGKPGKPGKPPTTTKKPTRPTEETTPHHTSTKKPSHKPTEPEQTTPALPGPEGQFKVVCYFTNWAWYRQGTGKYLPSDIDPNLCTHIVYGFAVLDTDRLVIKPHDSWADLDNKFYEKVTALKAKGVKVTLAIGGWNDSAGNKYSRLVNSRDARQRFNEHVLKFILENNFDGLDLDWEYPKCWQVDCNKGPDSDKQAFADWVTELRELFTPHGLLLSAAVSPAKTVIDNGQNRYDVKVLSDKLDWIAVMCYDYHGQWDKRTGHVAPMYIHDEDFDASFNANFTMHYWLSQGADRKKLVMGMPMYGQSFSLAENNENGLNAPTYGGGEAGDETRARGFLSYYEICDRVQRRGWEVVKDTTGAMGPYARSRDQWVSFDDAAMIKHKSEYVKKHDFGGAMIWALDLDDFRNTCGCEEYPLLRTINRVLRGYPEGPLCSLSKLKALEPPGFKVDPPCPPITGDKKDCTKFYTCQYGILIQQDCPPGLHFSQKTLMCDWPENAKCGSNEIPDENNENEQGEMVLPPSLQEITTTTTAVSIIEKPADTGEFKVVCYFTNWAWYRQGKGKYLPEDIDTSLCTHIIYAFAVLDSERLEIKPHDPWADIDNSFFTKVSSLVEKGIKVLLGLGGWNDSLGDKYSRLVNSPGARRNFVRQAVEFVDKYNFQGLDLDWEYPKCWQVDCNKGPETDKDGFAALVTELSEEFKRRGWLLSAAVSPSKTVINQAYDVPVLARHLDWISLMAYDYHGHWEGKTGHVAPLYYNEGDEFPHFNGNFSVTYWLDEGVPRKKLVLGMPLYGQSFTLRNESDTGLQAPISGPGMAGQFTRAAGFLAYYEICDTISRGNWVVKRHETGAIGPIAYKGNQWISYDDVEDIRRKSLYVKEHQLGGGMVWALDLDDFRNICGCGKNPLLSTINQELRGHPGNTNNCT